MDVIIRALSNDSSQIRDVQEFLFKMIKLEFGYDYVPEWHQDIVNMEDYYINPKENNFFAVLISSTFDAFIFFPIDNPYSITFASI